MKSSRFGNFGAVDSGKHDVARFAAHGDEGGYQSLSNDTGKDESDALREDSYPRGASVGSGSGSNSSATASASGPHDSYIFRSMHITPLGASPSSSFSSSSSFASNKPPQTWFQSVYRFIFQLFRLTRPRGTTPFLDLAAMMKSLLAAISILHLLSPEKILVSQDYAFVPPCTGWCAPLVIPEWLLRQQCQPALRIGNQLYIFQVFLVCNQIIFAFTSFLIHVNPYRILHRSHMRVFLSFFLGICSFVFGFCKIVILVSIPVTANIFFDCYVEKSGMMSDQCDDVSVVIPGFYFDRSSFTIPSCVNQFSTHLPIEVYLLSTTFVLTFLYSLFMCDTVLHYGEDEEIERTHLSDVDTNLKDEVEPDKEKKNEAQWTDSEEKSPEPTTIRARAGVDSTLTPSSGMSDKHLVNGIDVMFEHQRAIKAARRLTAQELLVCQIASAHMNQIQQQMKLHQYTYRMMRDVATLLKFIVTVVSLCLLLYNVTNSIVFCDRNQTALDPLLSLSPSAIQSQCQPELRSYTDSFYFASAAALAGLVFIFIIVLEKKVLVPRHSAFVSLVCIGAVILLLVIQLSLMIDLDAMPLVFPCMFPASVSLGNETLLVSETATCNEVTLNVTYYPRGSTQVIYEVVECSERCYINLGAGSYTLFASLALTLIYMGSLTWQYHRMAKAVIHAPTKFNRKMQQRTLKEDDETETAKGIVMDIMSKS